MLVFQASCSKAALSSATKDLLLEYSQNGVLARQELGSMLPVTALVRAGALTATKEPLRCLDLCASPGSKTLQAWEMLLTSRKGNESLDGKEKSPFLVANDILQSRLEALQHAVARSGMDETQHIVYTCQDASKFELRVASSSSSKKSGAVHINSHNSRARNTLYIQCSSFF